MASWIRVAEVIPVKKAFIRKVSAGSRDICLVGLNGKIYAVSAKCPHAGADLSQGWCVDKQLVCPVHRFKYDLETGRGAAGTRRLRRYFSGRN